MDTSGYPSMFISHYNRHGIKLVRPLSTVDNTRDYARVSIVDSGLTITYSSLLTIFISPEMVESERVELITN